MPKKLSRHAYRWISKSLVNWADSSRKEWLEDVSGSSPELLRLLPPDLRLDIDFARAERPAWVKLARVPFPLLGLPNSFDGVNSAEASVSEYINGSGLYLSTTGCICLGPDSFTQ